MPTLPLDRQSARRPVWMIALLLLIAVLLWQLPRWFSTPTEAQTLIAPPCDLNAGRCSATGDAIALSFGLSPHPLRALETLTADLQITGIEVQRATLSLEGRDMYMGLNQTALQFDPEEGHWHGTTELAVCTTGRMVWRAALRIETDAGTFRTWFDFEAQ